MTVAIHQPNFLPWLGYFYKITQCDVFVFLDDVDIETKTAKAITNRCKIKSATGEQFLTIPFSKGESKKINELYYVNSNWREKAIKTIISNYRKSKCYDEVFPLMEEIFKYESNNISEFNINAITKICSYMNIKTDNQLKSSEIHINTEDRNLRIIEICKENNADAYFSGKGGKNYHDEEIFQKNEIKIIYSDFQQKQYSQLYGEFVPNLSIIDLIFNEGKNSLKILLNH